MKMYSIDLFSIVFLREKFENTLEIDLRENSGNLGFQKCGHSELIIDKGIACYASRESLGREKNNEVFAPNLLKPQGSLRFKINFISMRPTGHRICPNTTFSFLRPKKESVTLLNLYEQFKVG